MMALTDEHLADLHQRARELGVPTYRMLTRDELIEAIEREGGGDAEPEVEAPEREAPAEAPEREGDSRREEEPPPVCQSPTRLARYCEHAYDRN